MSDTPLQDSRRIGPFVAVAAASLVIGAGGAWLVLQYSGGGTGEATRSAESAATTGRQGESPAMPGMEMRSGSEDTTARGVYISPARQQLIGVRTATVTRRPLNTTIRTVGTLAYDETRVTQIHTKVIGWIEQVYVDYVGKAVRRGQPLFTIYSPDLVATQNEYLLALKASQQLGESQFPETRAGAESLVSAARDRLQLWDITDAQIDELARTGQPRKTLTLYSPFDGVVLERNAFAGQYISPEMSTFKIADLSTIWVLGQIFEYETRLVKLGQEAEIQFPYGQSTRSLKGRITFIYPGVDPETRRVKVRIEFRNPGLEFKPESYVTVLLRAGMGEQLAVPKEAVLDNGSKRYAIVALPDGYFEPREIVVGEPVDDFFPAIQGLADGDPVVTSAQFLIDSETNLQAAMQAMSLSMHGTNMSPGSEGSESRPPARSTPATPAPADPSSHKP
ncbi:MAG: efflux RND transporter periplasmic adaptor subunit [Acidobacteria bacterium]|nr:efflux RND transporter periplasmic adaptor subunit [Acidobacteriota bacterium]